MNRMRLMAGLGALAALFAVWPVRGADAVSPVTVTITNVRSSAAQTININGALYRNSTLTFTNCKCYSGTTTTGTVQGLDGVTIEIAVGNLSTNTEYTGTAQVATNGTWSCASVTVPDMASFLIEVRLTDSNTNRYIYSTLTATAEQSMF